MTSIFRPSAPSQPQQVVQQPIIEEDLVDQRSIEDIDAKRRKNQQPSLLQLLSEGLNSPTIL